MLLKGYLIEKVKGRKVFLSFFIVLAITHTSFGQLCQGSLGDPVVSLTFGSGTGPGQALNSAFTNYTFTTNTCPPDGSYTINSSTLNCFNNTWHSVTEDHTPGDANGYMMIVNASYTPGDFYIETITGLCGGTTYELAAWLLNTLKPTACNNNSIQPNVTFTIETPNGTVLLSSKTGNIPSTPSPQWNQYGAFFKTPEGITAVVIRISNNSPGGCGNDIILDDITFRPCGAKVEASINSSSSINKDICTGDTASIFLNANYTGAETTEYQWQISRDNGINWTNIQGENSSTYRWVKETAVGSYFYRVIVARTGNIGTVNCRTASNVITINVNSTPIPSAGNNGPKCDGDNIILNASTGSSYLWTGPGNFTSSSQSPNIEAKPGKYFVTVTDKGCSGLDSTVVLVKTKPNANFSSVAAVCAKQLVQFTDASTSDQTTIATWNWEFRDGQISNGASPSHSFLNDGIYPIRLIVTNNVGCTDTAVHDIAINPLPVVKFGAPAICEGIQGRFIDSSTIKNSTENLFTYQWGFGDNTNSTQKDPPKTYSKGGDYAIKLLITSSDGCTNTATKKITVSSAPIADFTISGSEVCSNTSLTVTDKSAMEFGKISNTKIFWNIADNSDTTLDLNPAMGKQYQKSYTPFGSPAAKNFTIRYVTDNGAGCVSSKEAALILKASPQLVFDTVPLFCINNTATVINSARETSGLGGNGIYSGRGINNAGLFSPTAASPGNHSISYDYVATNGCRSSISRNFSVEALPEISAGADAFLLEGSSTILEASASAPNLAFTWTPAASLNSNNVLKPTASPKVETVYTLRATSANGCAAEDQATIFVLKVPVIPNAFSPNGDGINDVWNITYLDSYPGCTVDIFNRYGQPVFHSTGYDVPWNGSYKGQQTPTGVYYYIINPKNGLRSFSGSVTILH